MKAWQLIGLLVVGGGIVLLVLGVNASQSLEAEVRHELTGEYSNETIGYIAGGIVGVVLGAGLTLLPLRRRRRPGGA